MSSKILREVANELYFPRKLGLKSPKTRLQYEYSFRAYAKFLGHDPTLADLDDDLIVAWTKHLETTGRSAWTIREKVGRITALWNWLARRRVVEQFPCVEKLQAPEITPVAWYPEELNKLFESACKERGQIAGIPAGLWWVSHFAFMFSTAERKSAALAVKVAWIDIRHATCSIPASVRKGGRKTATYELWPEIIPMLSRLVNIEPNRELVWPWEKCEASYYVAWRRIIKDAGLPDDRKRKAHSLRCTHATMLNALGGDATDALMHSDPATTQKHYLDPRMKPRERPKIACPWGTELIDSIQLSAAGQAFV